MVSMSGVEFNDEEVSAEFGDALLADGFEEALIGFGSQFNHAVAIYDWEKCVDILVNRNQMSEDDAVEFMDFNVTGAWVGKNTPVFLKAKCRIVENIQ